MQNRDVIIISTQDYDDLRTRKQRWAERLAVRNRVLYVESQMHWVTIARNWTRYRSRLARSGGPPRRVGKNLWVWTPPVVLPFFQMSRIIGRLNTAVITRPLRSVVTSLGFRDPLLWLYTPYSAALVDQLCPAHTVYECVDDFAAAKGLLRASVVRSLEDETFGRADLTIVTAERLAGNAQGKTRRLRVSPNACDVGFFARSAQPETPIHPRIRDLDRPVFGFIGAVAYWVDLDLLAALARACPKAGVVLVGPVRVNIKPYQHLANMHFLGRQPYERIPEFLRGFDVCLNPYKCDDLARGASPLKLYEYLASGKPIVSTEMPEAKRFPGIVRVASSTAEFIESCRAAAGETDAQKVARVARQRRAVQPHTWKSRFEQIDRWLRESGIDSSTPSAPSNPLPRRLTLWRPPERQTARASIRRHIVINGLQVTGPRLGGGFTYLTNLVREMARTYPETSFTLILGEHGVSHFQWGIPNMSIKTLPSFTSWGPVRYVVERFLMNRLLARLGADVYLLPYGALPRAKRHPQVMVFQNLYFLHAKEFSHWASPSRWGRWYERYRLKAMAARLAVDVHRADRIVAVSETASTALRQRLGVPGDRITIAHEAVGEPFLSPDKTENDGEIVRRMNLPSQYFLTVGALMPNKNLPCLLRAFAQFKEEYPDGPELLIAGPDWRLFSRVLAEIVDRLGIREWVHRLGFVDPGALAVLYRRAVGVVQLSGCESFGLPVLEAMASGAPTVVANRSGLAEIGGDAAIHVDPSDTAAIARIMAHLWHDPAWRAQWIRRGRKRARHFDWCRTARDTYAAIAQAAGWLIDTAETAAESSHRCEIPCKTSTTRTGQPGQISGVPPSDALPMRGLPGSINHRDQEAGVKSP